MAEQWVHKFQKQCHLRYFSAQQSNNLWQYLDDAVHLDFNMIIEDFKFYQRLQPRDQTQLINLIFGDFKQNFSHFFEGLQNGFINEFIVNLYCRTYANGQEILSHGTKNSELFFIVQGCVAVRTPTGLKEPFLILP